MFHFFSFDKSWIDVSPVKRGLKTCYILRSEQLVASLFGLKWSFERSSPANHANNNLHVLCHPLVVCGIWARTIVHVVMLQDDMGFQRGIGDYPSSSIYSLSIRNYFAASYTKSCIFCLHLVWNVLVVPTPFLNFLRDSQPSPR